MVQSCFSRAYQRKLGYALDSDISAITIPLTIDSVDPSTIPEVCMEG